MQINTLLPYAKSYADSTFRFILHHIQINVMLHVGTIKSMYLKRTKKIYILILLNVQ
jgi:hypothetical protein